MVKRNVKRALSVILSIVLMFTTFFIFDPDVLKIDTGAYVGKSEMSLSYEDVYFYVPEVIYLAPSTTGETGTVPFNLNGLPTERMPTTAQSQITLQINTPATFIFIVS